MIGTVDVDVQAKFPNMPLDPMIAYVGSPSSIRVRNVPKRIGDWCIRSVEFTAIYPDGTIKSASCVLTGGVWVGTIQGTSTSGTSKNGYTIFASGTDENGNTISGYILGKGDITILDADGKLTPNATRYYVRLLSAESEEHFEGDMYKSNGAWYIWQDNQAWPICNDSSKIAELSASVESLSDELNAKQDALSADELSAIGQSLYDLQSKIQYADYTTDYFISPSFMVSRSTLQDIGAIDENGQWLKEPRQVYLGTNVTTLNNGLFEGATKLLVFDAPNAANIPSRIFYGCSALAEINIPKLVQITGSNVFYGCSALTSLTLPKSVYSIARSAFNGSALQQVIFEGKTIEQVKAMTNFSRWGLAEDKILTYAFRSYVDEGLASKADLSAVPELSAQLGVKRDLSDIAYPASIEGDDYNITKWTLVIEGQDELINGTWDLHNFTHYDNMRLWSAVVPRPEIENVSLQTSDGESFRVDMSITRSNYESNTDVHVYGYFTLADIVNGRPESIDLTWEYRDGSDTHQFTAVITPTLKQTTFALRDYVDAELARKANLSSVGNATITLTQGGVTKGTFATNQSANATIDLDAGGGGGGGSGYAVTINCHQMDGTPHSSIIKIGGFTVEANTYGLAADGHHVSEPLVMHGIEYVDVPGASDEVYFNGVRRADQFVTLSGDTTIDMYFLVCIASGTLVHLANGTTKPIEDITYDDDLLVWDFDEGRLSSAKPAWIKKADYVFYSWETKLASGKSIKTCGQHGHRFFDLGTNTWVYADEISGKTVYTLDGADEVISSERIDGKVNFYNIITKGHINHFGNGILLGCSLENKLYPVANMKFVKDNRALRPYSEFAGDVPEWWYNECRYAESTASRDYLAKYCKDRLPIMLPKS